MATGALDANGIWQYGEDDSNTTFSALLNRLGTSIGSDMKGRVLQIVSATTDVQVFNNTTSFVSTGLTATITPKKSSSKILVIAMTNGIAKEPYNASSRAMILLRRGATNIAYSGNIGYTGSGTILYGLTAPHVVLDSPNTTSATTYATYIADLVSGNGVTAQTGSTQSEIILVEVSA